MGPWRPTARPCPERGAALTKGASCYAQRISSIHGLPPNSWLSDDDAELRCQGIVIRSTACSSADT